MGAFDYVNFEMDCPDCGTHVTGFQSKDSECLGHVLEPEAVDNFYSSCSKCNKWLEFSRPESPDQVPVRMHAYTLSEVLVMGFKRSGPEDS